MEKTSQLCETSKQHETDDRANCNSMLRMCSESYKKNEYSKKSAKREMSAKAWQGEQEQPLCLFRKLVNLIHFDKNVAYKTIVFSIWIIIYSQYKTTFKKGSCMWLIYNQVKPKYVSLYIWLNLYKDLRGPLCSDTI